MLLDATILRNPPFSNIQVSNNFEAGCYGWNDFLRQRSGLVQHSILAKPDPQYSSCGSM